MNKVILMGRLTRDAEVRKTQGANGEMTVARFNLAVDRKARDAGSDFINCTAFGKSAEFFEKFGHKGTKFVIEGRIQTGSYTNKNGDKVYTTDVIVEQQEFAESKGSGNNAGSASDQGRKEPEKKDGFMNIPEGIDEEMPFN